MKIILTLLLSYVWAAGNALNFDPFKGPAPIAVLMQTDPWLMVIGSDTPRLVIYEDGQVVYVKEGKAGAAQLLGKKLNAEELAAVKKKLASFADYSKLKHYYDKAPGVTDQPSTNIYLSLSGKEFVTGIYGLKWPAESSAASFVSEGPVEADKIPAELTELYTYLASLSFTDAKPWAPAYFEVFVGDYSYAPEKSIYWPKKWPGLNSPYTFKMDDGYSIFMPISELPKVEAFLKTRNRRGAVEIDGKKWAAYIRKTFPGEPVWTRAFEKGIKRDPADQKKLMEAISKMRGRNDTRFEMDKKSIFLSLLALALGALLIKIRLKK